MSSKKRALITGITGQDGSYLAELLLEKGYDVYGVVYSKEKDEEHFRNILSFRDAIALIEGDITDLSVMKRIVHKVLPDEFYNLAAQSSVGASFANPHLTYQITGIGVINCLEAVRTESPQTKFFQAGSAEMFGDTDAFPQNETHPFKPASPYAIAKVMAHHAVVNYRTAFNVFACNGILFNHESPRRGDMFVTQKIIKTARDIADGKQKTLTLGNVQIKRDWGYAKDYVAAMHMMLVADIPDDYIIATGTSITLEDFVRKVFEKVGLEYEKHVIIDEGLYRPHDAKAQCGDSTKIQEKLHWKPEVDIDQLIDIMLASYSNN
jgi:GDPmannose 4,6-dehydratase